MSKTCQERQTYLDLKPGPVPDLRTNVETDNPYTVRMSETCKQTTLTQFACLRQRKPTTAIAEQLN